jgi:hypothetical protein
MTKLEEGQAAYQQRHHPQEARRASGNPDRVRDSDEGSVSTSTNPLQRGRDISAARNAKRSRSADH